MHQRSAARFWIAACLLCALFALPAGARPAHETPALAGPISAPVAVIRASDQDVPSRILPPFDPDVPRPQTATFDVTYNGFTPQAQAAFQYAVDLWAAQIESPVPITVNATWQDLGTGGVLGSAGPILVIPDGAFGTLPATWYPTGVVNRLAGADLLPDVPDIQANFNSNPVVPWYFGTDGQPAAGQYDFVSVVLHELGHGLGFTGAFRVENTAGGPLGSWGTTGSGDPNTRPFIFDRGAINGAGAALVDTTLFPNPSLALGAQLTGDNLFLNGANTLAAAGAPVKLYVPPTWEPGSSYAHLDEVTYGAGDPNSLMTPSINAREVIHDPGPITRGILRDIGWAVTDPILPGTFELTSSGGSVATSDQQLQAVFTTNTVTTTTQITLTDNLAINDPLPADDAVPLRGFNLTAVSNGMPVLQFQQPYTLTLVYADTTLLNRFIAEDTLAVALRAADGSWTPIQPTATCPTCGVTRDPLQNRLFVVIDRSGTFAAYGTTYRAFQPLVIR